MGFVFFDTETTGLKCGFDQIVHFAAIRTDNDLKEIDRFEARCRLLPHVIPHPIALQTNGLPIARLTDETLPSHYEMISGVRQKLLSWSPSIFVGYNSIRFDEEMLRHAFFQTLYPAYLTSRHGNCRADALGLVMAASTLSPSCLSVPDSPDGRLVFRLEQLAAANGVAHPRAHDAMADVMATLGLCQQVHDGSTELWQRFVRFSKKATVSEFVDAEDGFYLTEFFGNEAYHMPVVCVGPDPNQPNGRLCLHLDFEVEQLVSMPDDELRAKLAAKPSPVQRIRINAAPTLTAFYDAPDGMLNGAAVDRLEVRARRIKDDSALCGRVIAAYVATREPRAPSTLVESQIYDCFPGPDDEVRMAAFQDADWPEAFTLVQNFSDERLRTFGLRLIYFGGRSVLPVEAREKIERELTDRLVEDLPGGLGLQQALRETEALIADSVNDDTILVDYRAYLLGRIKRVSDFRSRLFGN